MTPCHLEDLMKRMTGLTAMMLKEHYRNINSSPNLAARHENRE